MAGSVVFDAQTRVTGGDKLYTFIDKLQSPRLYETMAERFVREFPMQLFRQRLPEGASGRLRRQIRLVQRGSSVFLLGVWYARFAADIEGMFYSLAYPLARRIAREVITEAAR